MWVTSAIFFKKKPVIVNNHPLRENSPNLVTLIVNIVYVVEILECYRQFSSEIVDQFSIK
jgi:hypothetical protein